jgi:hypothetical protein
VEPGTELEQGHIRSRADGAAVGWMMLAMRLSIVDCSSRCAR